MERDINFPIFIVPIESGQGFSASLGAPFNVTVEAPTTNEVEEKIKKLVRKRFDEGGEVRWISLLGRPPYSIQPGWLPDDDITREWLECMQEYRRECDERERKRILEEDTEKERAAL